ncbi:phosphate-starvation-inducible protein PsiE [Celerinatantimonas yamalensis]|uniref:Protein PsiE n=1 Tax=Celerinatantimonas yamalensis TaxID=559956 RepID=A0ABW9G9P5_9GAMM
MNKFKRAWYKSLVVVEDLGLIFIAALTMIAMGEEIWKVVSHFEVTLPDLLLLFIYLEVLAMVGLYLKSGRFPVRMPLYIVIVALARYIMLDMKNLDTLRTLGLAGAMLVIALAVLVIRFGHTKYPYHDGDDDD